MNTRKDDGNENPFCGSKLKAFMDFIRDCLVIGALWKFVFAL